ncbi:hypothetical protein [Leeia aquatica]|uniref:Uncharacterized protein n=1 Tax=Leeia aquatica TaxID=2725557 RepID=A0A847S595_9NEIS|nr:hypothetical protein [Leeia aquatica]NLR74287.1 hypothetical protein [Leeia aquatica]
MVLPAPPFTRLDGTLQAMLRAPSAALLLEGLHQEPAFAEMPIVGLKPLLEAAWQGGEDYEEEHVAMQVDGRWAVGTFEHLHDLTVGDALQLVVAPSTPLNPAVSLIRGIHRVQDGLLWLPFGCEETQPWRSHLPLFMFSLVVALFTGLLSTLIAEGLTFWAIGNGLMLAILLLGIYLQPRKVKLQCATTLEVLHGLGIPQPHRLHLSRHKLKDHPADAASHYLLRSQLGHVFNLRQAQQHRD